MVPKEIFELIIGNINLYKTCKSFYRHKEIAYKNYEMSYDKINAYDSGLKILNKQLLDYDHIYKIHNFNGGDLLNFNNLTNLKLNMYYDEILPVLPSLSSLTIGRHYNQVLPIFPSLTYLDLEDNYNEMLPVLTSLIYLKLGRHYNQLLSNLPSLSTLILGYYYNKPLPELPSLTYLNLGHFYNHPLNSNTLKILKIPKNYKTPCHLPNLKELHVEDNIIYL